MFELDWIGVDQNDPQMGMVSYWLQHTIYVTDHRIDKVSREPQKNSEE